MTRGRGRPSTGVRVDIRVPADVLAELDERAESEGTTRAVVIRRILTATAFPSRTEFVPAEVTR